MAGLSNRRRRLFAADWNLVVYLYGPDDEAMLVCNDSVTSACLLDGCKINDKSRFYARVLVLYEFDGNVETGFFFHKNGCRIRSGCKTENLINIGVSGRREAVWRPWKNRANGLPKTK